MSDQTPQINQYAPAPPTATEPSMSTGETLMGIFFEPGRTFASLRERPRFLIAALIIVIVFFAYYLLYFQRIGYENVVTAEVEVQSQKSNATPEQKQQGIKVQMNPIVKAIRYGAPIINFLIFFAAGAGLYLLGAMMMARSITFKQALTVWTYSSLPPTVLTMLVNIALLFVRPPDPTDPSQYAEIVRGQGGLAHANLGMLISDPNAHPVLATTLGAFDIFAFYGLFLAALGLRKVGKMPSGTAWGIVITIWLLFVVLRIAFAGLLGRVIG